MRYWVAFKNGKYISARDKLNNLSHTEDKEKAFKFYDFDEAMSYFNLGYCIIKESKY